MRGHDEMFVLVVKYCSIQVLLWIRTMLDIKFYQMEVIMVFLDGDLKEDVYIPMVQPKGYEKLDFREFFCKL